MPQCGRRRGSPRRAVIRAEDSKETDRGEKMPFSKPYHVQHRNPTAEAKPVTESARHKIPAAHVSVDVFLPGHQGLHLRIFELLDKRDSCIVPADVIERARLILSKAGGLGVNGYRR